MQDDERRDATPLTSAGDPQPWLQPALEVGRRLAGGRFELVRAIGRGGMGVVYEVVDHERRAHVALKMLAHVDASSIYRLKNEFRTLAGVSHPNLVRLHELFADGVDWFFTMDLVRGQPFDSWVRPAGGLDHARLRAALRQLADAADAVHEMGKLHLDLKPSNVLVRDDGQLVVLDFGLASEPQLGGIGQTLAGDCVSGTPAYMAPEQAAGKTAGVAADFYAIGVMLHEALTGRLPFEGSVASVLAAKRSTRAAPPDSIDAQRAPDLARLCNQLLDPDPATRMDRAHLSSVLGEIERAPLHQPRWAADRLDPAPVVLLGRESELRVLSAGYRTSLLGHGAVVVMRGPGGIGKTSVCRAFLGPLRGDPEVVVLAGRCHEHESLPFKAFDGLADGLGRYLRRLPVSEATALLPRHAQSLTAVFPALGRVHALASAPREGVSEGTEWQRRAFTAFAELLGRIRDRHPVVLCIEDLQWIDRDSVSLLRKLLIDRCHLPVLLVLTQRDDGGGLGALVEDVMQAVQLNPDWRYFPVDVPPLSEDASAALARRLLPDEELASDLVQALAIESRGNPLVLGELALFALSQPEFLRAPLSYPEMLGARVAALPIPCQRLMEVIAVAGQPIHPDVALAASGADYSDLERLRSADLVRASAEGDSKSVESAHDRIREAISILSSQEGRSASARDLARALAARPDSDPELVLRCLLEAGERQNAAPWAEIAAARALAALAFDHASRLLSQALELSADHPGSRLELLTKLGGALADAGRGLEAAGAYTQAAAAARADRALELDLRRRAAEQMFAVGELAGANELLRDVCREAGVRIPEDSLRMKLARARRIKRLRAGGGLDLGARFEARAASPSEWELLRLRTMHTTLLAFAGYRPRDAVSIALDYLEAASQAGQPRHMTWALGALALYVPPLRTVLGDAIELLVREHGGTDEYIVTHATLLRGIITSERGEFLQARCHLEEALVGLRRCDGTRWQIDIANLYVQDVAWACGDALYLQRTTPGLVEDALRSGRIWAAAVLSGFAGSFAWLAAGDVEGCRRQIELVRRRWKPQARRQLPDYCLEMADAALAIYAGEPDRGFELLDADRTTYQEAVLRARGGERYAIYALTAASALRANITRASSSRRSQWRRALRKSSSMLRKGGAPAPAYVCDAVLSLERADVATAIRWLSQALVRYEATGMAMHAAATRRRLGQLRGGERGDVLLASGDAFMATQGIKDVEAITELLCPGCRPP